MSRGTRINDLARIGGRPKPKKKNDTMRLTIAVITLVLLATLVGMAPAILISLYQHWRGFHARSTRQSGMV